MKRILVGIAAIGAIGAGVGYWYTHHGTPPVAAVVTQDTPTLRPVQPQGPHIVLEKGEDKGKKDKTKVATVAAKPQPKPVEKLAGVGPERKLPTLGEKRGLTMFANLQTISPTLLRVDLTPKYNGLKEPGKGYFKIKPTVIRDKARPFVETEGSWASTDPPIYLIWSRDKATPLPAEFTMVYIRNGTHFPVDLSRALLNGRDDVVVKRVPGDKDNTYVSLPKR